MLVSIHLFLFLITLAGGIYLSQVIEKNDAAQKEAELKQLVTSTEYSKFPEVTALKEQALFEENTPLNQNAIESNLTQVLSRLDKEYTEKLKALIIQAKVEYSFIKEKGEAGSLNAFIKKYFGLLKGLEQECDVRVYAALQLAESDLKRYGYNTTHVEEAREHYHKVKAERRKQLIK